ncbi:MAG TPA: efflux RND transporter periplasmic adaptor subunit [Vicinamibacterales bacterium]|nr:efflux RND transporter periplasmic adaptor subunit [Vicinamibacterales bacterium]
MTHLPLNSSIARLFALFLLVAASSAAACRGNQEPASGAGGAAALPPTDVMTLTLEPKPVPRASEFVATIRSLRSTTIQPQVEGFVRRIFVKAGDQVRSGQPLIQIDPDRQQASIITLESQVAAREADLAFATQQITRMKKLHQAGAVSLAELEQAETAHKNAEAQLTAVRSQIKENEVQLQYYRVIAPVAGIVGEIPVREGDRVTTATPITTIDQAEGLEAYLNVPLERATELKPGLAVELLDDAGKVIASNPVTFIAPRADDATQSVLVKATLQRRPPGLRVMQYVKARLVFSNEPALVVPVVAVNRIAGQHFVFVAEGTGDKVVARQKPITVGTVVDDSYVVLRGLAAGERVIVSNVQKIGDGSPVKVG